MSQGEMKNAWLTRLQTMEFPLSKSYSNPIDLVTNAVTKNLVGFTKLHLKKPHMNGLDLLTRSRVFALELEGGGR
jgi:hypothetical protein